MKHLRAAIRLLLFLVLTLATLLLFSVSLVFCVGNPRRRVSCKNVFIRYWARLVALLIGCRITVEGPVPEAPFFMVSNHLSYMDILPFWGYLSTTFIAKSEIESWPLFGFAARLMGILFIDRSNNRDLGRVNRLIRRQLQHKDGVILFPEGTSSKGAQVLPFKSSLLYYPARQHQPVYYATLRYAVEDQTEAAAWKDICWWGDMRFLPHFWNLLKIRTWHCRLELGEAPVIYADRKELARELHQKIAAHFSPLPGIPPTES